MKLSSGATIVPKALDSCRAGQRWDHRTPRWHRLLADACRRFSRGGHAIRFAVRARPTTEGSEGSGERAGAVADGAARLQPRGCGGPFPSSAAPRLRQPLPARKRSGRRRTSPAPRSLADRRNAALHRQKRAGRAQGRRWMPRTSPGRTSVARLDNARPINPQVPSKPSYGGGGNRTRVRSRTE